jgi:hypothetical protein
MRRTLYKIHSVLLAANRRCFYYTINWVIIVRVGIAVFAAVMAAGRLKHASSQQKLSREVAQKATAKAKAKPVQRPARKEPPKPPVRLAHSTRSRIPDAATSIAAAATSYLRDQLEVDRNATPEWPQLPQALTANSTAHDIWASNFKLVLSYGTADDKWFFCSHPVAFKDGRAKANWKMFYDTQAFLTYAQWAKKRMDGCAKSPARIGFFCTWTRSWVGQTDWKTADWHVWGAAWRPHEGSPRAKELLIWDSNCERQFGNTSETVYLAQLLGMQRNLITILEKEARASLKKIYIGGSGNRSPGICMSLTQQWITNICKDYDATLPSSQAELEVLGYRVLSKRTPPPSTGISPPPGIESTSSSAATAAIPKAAARQLRPRQQIIVEDFEDLSSCSSSSSDDKKDGRAPLPSNAILQEDTALSVLGTKVQAHVAAVAEDATLHVSPDSTAEPRVGLDAVPLAGNPDEEGIAGNRPAPQEHLTDTQLPPTQK